MHYFTEQNIFIFLVQVFLLLGLARAAGELFRRFRQPALTGEILVGVILGPTIFGRFLPNLYQNIFPQDITQKNMLETVIWLGLLFFLLETGLKMDFSSAWRHRGKALTIALTGIIVPMALGFFACLLLPEHYLVNPRERLVFAFFMATVMTISAMPTAARALNDLDLAKTDLGFLIMSALSVNEIIGWVVFAFILHFLNPAESIQAQKIFLIFSGIVAVIIFCLTFGRRFSDFVISKIKEYGLPEPASSLTFISLLGFLCGAIFQKIGVSALLGFFIAGIMAGEARALSERTRQVISQMVYAIFIPLFFAGIGLKADFVKHFDVGLVIFIAGLGIFGKFFGAWLGALFSGLAKENIMPLAIAHTPGGSMEIVIGILALQYGLINEVVFVAIVSGGIISSLILGPWLKYVVNKRKEISILEFFSKRVVIADLKSGERNGAIHELCTVIAEQGNTPHPDTLYSAVLRRENTMGTAIEEGVAIPHARLGSLVKPIVAFSRSNRGIEWNSPDGKPTHFIFLILTPKEDDWSQVEILRIIAKAMSDKNVSQAIAKAGDHNDLWQALEHAFTQHRIARKGKGK
ncbi:MAG: cation:proton antiporter [Candidatus Omnitrophota bacterium]|nr:cation:proton antiporter [Candidatus Omnitrophota bacterium]